MANPNINKSNDTPNDTVSDSELKSAELERIKAEKKRIEAEEKKLDAETQEINDRKSKPWWYIKPSAFIQSIVAGIVAAAFVSAFFLEQGTKIYTMNKELKELLEESNEKLKKRNGELNALLEETVKLNNEQKERIEVLETTEKENLLKAQKNLNSLENAEVQDQEIIEAKNEIKTIEKRLSDLEEEARKVQDTATQLDELIQSRLAEFTIQIRYDSKSETAEDNAKKIKSVLANIKVNNVELIPTPKNELNNRWRAQNNLLRFHEETEQTEASLLIEKIKISADVILTPNLASTKSPKILTIFLV